MAASMEPPESCERPARAACCTLGTVVGLSDVPLLLLLPDEYTRPLLRPALAFVALGLALIVGSWLRDHRGRLLGRQGDGPDKLA
jgi:hypothetical protein